jgi:hypothetical protein
MNYYNTFHNVMFIAELMYSTKISLFLFLQSIREKSK